MSFRSIVLGLIAFLGLAGLPFGAGAEDWPSRPVRLIVPYPPGTATDVLGRVLADRLQAKWHQPVIVDNKPGGSEVIAANAEAQAKPDGYTLLMFTEIGLETNQFLFSKLSYDAVSDFTPIVKLVEGPLVLVVRSDSPYKTLQDLVDAAKKQPDSVTYGSAGVGGSIHLVVNWLGKLQNAKFKQVAYRGSSLAVQDVLAKVVDFTLTGPPTAAPFLKSGDLRALAVTSGSRSKALPDVPTTEELGFKDSAYQFMFGLVGPAKLPADLAQKIATDVTAILNDPEFQKANTDPFGYAVAGGTPAAFTQFLAVDREKQKQRVKAANVKLD